MAVRCWEGIRSRLVESNRFQFSKWNERKGRREVRMAEVRTEEERENIGRFRADNVYFGTVGDED